MFLLIFLATLLSAVAAQAQSVPVLRVSNHTACGAGAVSTCNVSITGVVSGDVAILGVGWCVSNCGANSTAGDPITGASNNNSDTCSHATGTYSDGAGGAGGVSNHVTDIWFCPITHTNAGSVTFTITWSSALAYFATVSVADFSDGAASPDDGKGNADFNDFTNTISVATNGSVTQINEIIYSAMRTTSATTISGAGQTQIDNYTSGSGAFMTEYQIPGTTGTKTNTGTMSGNGRRLASIAAFKSAPLVSNRRGEEEGDGS